MFIIELIYEKSIEEIEKHLKAHKDFLDENYEKGIFIASGAKVPRSGGIVIAVSGSKEDLEAVVKQDPFIINGVAGYKITEFLATKTCKELESFRVS